MTTSLGLNIGIQMIPAIHMVNTVIAMFTFNRLSPGKIIQIEYQSVPEITLRSFHARL